MKWRSYQVEGSNLDGILCWGAQQGEWTYVISFDPRYPELGYSASRRRISAPTPYKVERKSGAFHIGLKPGEKPVDPRKGHPEGTFVVLEGAKSFTQAEQACSRLARGLS